MFSSLTEIVQRYHSHVESESKPSAGAGEAQVSEFSIHINNTLVLIHGR